MSGSSLRGLRTSKLLATRIAPAGTSSGRWRRKAQTAEVGRAVVRPSLPTPDTKYPISWTSLRDMRNGFATTRKGSDPRNPLLQINGKHSSDNPDSSTGSVETQQTLSQLAARILDQLSTSAWLPAAALVGLVLLIGSVRNAHGDIARAFERISSMSFAAVILLLVATVIMTMLTQAFQFEAIQFLEGYWGPRDLPVRIADWRADRHNRRRVELKKEFDEGLAEAKEFVRSKWTKDPPVDETTVAVAVRLVLGETIEKPSRGAKRARNELARRAARTSAPAPRWTGIGAVSVPVAGSPHAPDTIRQHATRL